MPSMAYSQQQRRSPLLPVLIIIVVVLVILAIVETVYFSNTASQLAEAQEELADIQADVDEAQATNDTLVSQTNLEGSDLIEWRNAQGRLAFLGDESGKVAYLTFDDGPCDANTPQLLETLKENDAVATWFVLADDEEYEYLDLDLLADIEAQGCAVGLHDWDHNDNFTFYKGTVKDYFKNDFNKLQEKVEGILGHEVHIMRFVGGSATIGYYNSGIATSLPEEMLKKGNQYFDWNVSAGDSEASEMVDGVVPTDTLINNVISQAKDFADTDSSICILMHDNPGKTTTVEALPKIIKGLKDLGYSFGTLDTSKGGYYQQVIGG